VEKKRFGSVDYFISFLLGIRLETAAHQVRMAHLRSRDLCPEHGTPTVPSKRKRQDKLAVFPNASWRKKGFSARKMSLRRKGKGSRFVRCHFASSKQPCRVSWQAVVNSRTFNHLRSHWSRFMIATASNRNKKSIVLIVKWSKQLHRMKSERSRNSPCFGICKAGNRPAYDFNASNVLTGICEWTHGGLSWR